MIYGVVSDLHNHAWSTFAHTNSDGVNSRLAYTIAELKRAAAAVKALGGNRLICAGDIFHTRGQIDPEVLNPVREAFHDILKDGLDVDVIPGNHDLKSKDTQKISSAVQNLEQTLDLEQSMLRVHNQATIIAATPGDYLGFVPWRWTQEALLEDLQELSKHRFASRMDVFIHAGIDGVLSGMPAHGLTDKMLADFGFRRVFAGHYHNHHDFGNGVYSIGALTHQTWGDVGTRAGFLIVDTDKETVTFHDTQAPKFKDLSGLDEVEMELECKNSFVRFRGPAMTQDQINELRDLFKSWGAIGVSIEVPRAVVAARSAAPAKGMTLEQTVEKFVKDADPHPTLTAEQITKRALETLEASRVIYEDA